MSPNSRQITIMKDDSTSPKRKGDESKNAKRDLSPRICKKPGASASKATDNRQFGRRPNALVKRWYSFVERGLAVDLGCANGATSKFLARKGFKTVGIDLKLPLTLHSSKNLRFLRRDIRNLSFRPLGRPSLIVMSHVLQFLSSGDKYAVLEKAWGALRPGGILILESFTTKDPGFTRAKQRGALEKEANSFLFEDTGEHRSFFESEELRSWKNSVQGSLLEYQEAVICDDHPPLGRHRHGVVRCVLTKPRVVQ